MHATTTSRRLPLVPLSPNSDTLDLSYLRLVHHKFGVEARRSGTNVVISPGLGAGSGPAGASALSNPLDTMAFAKEAGERRQICARFSHTVGAVGGWTSLRVAA